MSSLCDIGVCGVSYLSYFHYERLAAGDTAEGRLGVIFGTCCIVKLYLYATFYNSFLILIVANDFSHVWSIIVPWSWVFD